MRLYAFLDRFRLPGGYGGKFFFIAFLGVHLPLIAGLCWLLSAGGVDWPLLGILLAATLVGTGLTLLGLHALLAPVRAATLALEGYARDGALPRMPTTHGDLAGRLMTRAQETLAGLDTALTAARGGLAEARESMTRRERALAEVTHELRSPLNAVLGFAELIQMQSHGPLGHPRYAEFVADIASSGEHMLALVEDVQRFAAVTGGRESLDPRPQDLFAAAERASRLLRREEETRGVAIRVAVPRGLRVTADGRALLQLLLNLVGNAVKYAGRGATVTVSAERRTGETVVTVRDDGVGMTPDELREALEPFGRAARAREAGVKGTGLGLPLAKALAEAGGGTFALESDRGCGTVARFTLPETVAA